MKVSEGVKELFSILVGGSVKKGGDKISKNEGRQKRGDQDFLKIFLGRFAFFDVAIATFKNLLKMAVLKGHLNKADKEKVG